jgi:arylsulfatase
LKAASQGKTGFGLYPDGMAELDGYVGQLLKKLDDLKVADNTIVCFTTDNGAEKMSWPDGGQSPFRGEKDTNWEGGWRVPFVMRWPGVIKPGTIVNEICSLQDMIPTFAAAAGEPDLVEKVKKGYTADGKKFKVHLDGFNLLPFLKGDEKKCPREGFLYWSDDGELLALRVHQWKAVFMEQRAHGLDVWREPFSQLRIPKIFNLRADPFEEGEDGFFYDKWMADRAFLLVPAQMIVAQWLESFKEFPPRQKPASFNVDHIVEHMMPK